MPIIVVGQHRVRLYKARYHVNSPEYILQFQGGYGWRISSRTRPQWSQSLYTGEWHWLDERQW